ncbi:Sodium-dependent phosphate transporter 1-A, partial [Trichinella pseudospiralis]
LHIQNNMTDLLWVVVVAFFIALVLSFAIGANDTANSFGTSVGSKVLTLRQAYLLATLVETCGAVLLGCAGWLMMATLFKLPVSTTHSIVGATIGYSLVLRGLNGIRWSNIGFIVASWFLSPVLSGCITSIFYLLINSLILKQDDQFNAGLKVLPYLYFFTFSINIFSIFYDGTENSVHLEDCKICPVAYVLPKENEQPLERETEITGGRVNCITQIKKFFKPETKEESQCIKLFNFLQIFSACFGGFAHGGNDVSNAIAPLISIWMLYHTNSVYSDDEGPTIWLLLYGAAGMVIGLWVLGHRVIYTVGEGLTELNAIRIRIYSTVCEQIRIAHKYNALQNWISSVRWIAAMEEKRLFSAALVALLRKGL